MGVSIAAAAMAHPGSPRRPRRVGRATALDRLAVGREDQNVTGVECFGPLRPPWDNNAYCLIPGRGSQPVARMQSPRIAVSSGWDCPTGWSKIERLALCLP